jgi:hypothetical protein
MFKIGDVVLCVNDYNPGTKPNGDPYLVENCTYIIIYISDNGELIGFDFDTCPSWYSTRFVLDIKEQRKQKLKNLCLNQEIK